MRVTNVALAAMVVLIAASVSAQSTQPSMTVPRLINISGVFQPADGSPGSRVEVVTLAIYADETGGTPVWQETQSIDVDPAGRYTLLLGATRADGVPLDVFASGEARWVGMLWSRPGEVEGPRTRLTSVPYALNAANAETLGGKPATAYVLVPTSRQAGDASSTTTTAPGIEPTAVNAGTTNFMAKYVNPADVGDSAVYEVAGRVGINTGAVLPSDYLHVKFNDPFGAFTGLAVQNTNGGPNAASGMLFLDQNGALAQFQGFNNSNHAYAINNIAPGGSINFLTGSVSRFFVSPNGNIGIGTANPQARLHIAGDAMVDGNIGAKYQDVAEWVESSEPLEAGTVVVIDAASTDRVIAAKAAYDVAVAGAVSAQPGLTLGERGPGKVLVAQSGRVRIKADARYGAIRAGDLLVTSPTKGYAMRSKPVRVGGTRMHRPGTVLGKALEPLAKGTGEILVLLTLQ